MSGEYFYGGVAFWYIQQRFDCPVHCPVEVLFIADKVRSQIVRFRRVAS